MFKNKQRLPKLYSEAEITLIEKHITENFGEFKTVMHELVSPDIHVDIAVIDPTPERNYYTLITMGMGAHVMNVPKKLIKTYDRAEIAICLPSDWKISETDEKWYWPLRLLQFLARLPLGNNTWLGFGHTAPNWINGKSVPFAENTKLVCAMLTNLINEKQSANICRLPNGNNVIFYQVITLYEHEMNSKLVHGANALLKLFDLDKLKVLNINRESPVQTVEDLKNAIQD